MPQIREARSDGSEESNGSDESGGGGGAGGGGGRSSGVSGYMIRDNTCPSR